MTNERAIELLNCEKECVKRQFGPMCKRTIIPMEGCFGCDLVQNDKDVLDAYDVAIRALKEQDSGCGTCIRNADGEPCESNVCDYERRPTDV